MFLNAEFSQIFVQLKASAKNFLLYFYQETFFPQQ